MYPFVHTYKQTVGAREKREVVDWTPEVLALYNRLSRDAILSTDFNNFHNIFYLKFKELVKEF